MGEVWIVPWRHLNVASSHLAGHVLKACIRMMPSHPGHAVALLHLGGVSNLGRELGLVLLAVLTAPVFALASPANTE